MTAPVGKPRTAKEALGGAEAAEWREAMQAEWSALEQNETRDVANPGVLPRGKKPIRTKWVFKRKLHADGSVARYKARLVAQGFSPSRRGRCF